MLFGVSMTSAVSAGVIMAAIPATVALLSWAFLRERIAGRTWTRDRLRGARHRAARAGEAAAQRRSGGAASAWLGNLLVFGAVLCEAVVRGDRQGAHRRARAQADHRR